LNKSNFYEQEDAIIQLDHFVIAS